MNNGNRTQADARQIVPARIAGVPKSCKKHTEIDHRRNRCRKARARTFAAPIRGSRRRPSPKKKPPENRRHDAANLRQDNTEGTWAKGGGMSERNRRAPGSETCPSTRRAERQGLDYDSHVNKARRPAHRQIDRACGGSAAHRRGGISTVRPGLSDGPGGGRWNASRRERPRPPCDRLPRRGEPAVGHLP